MAEYITLAQLKRSMGVKVSSTDPGVYDQITDRIPPFDTADDDVASEFIAETGAFIDTYLARRYTLPLTDTADLLAVRGVHRWFVVWNLWQSHPNAADTPENVLQGYRQARDWLDAIAAGDVKLPSDVGGSSSDYGAWEQVFTEDVCKQL